MHGEVRDVWPVDEAIMSILQKNIPDLGLKDELSILFIRVLEGLIKAGDLLSVSQHKAYVYEVGKGDLLLENSREIITATCDIPYSEACTFRPNRVTGAPGATVSHWETA
ncbi:hypothetical protein PsW64_03746 [Pseudovibrio sp. W64]|uniref:hypothetical protein n=1 Tax=Pseudovibrio TaxID=258255 RepID=UPI0007AE5420|nr:hypothetical protein [Pseudovibrio sp. W64]KZK78108.1 hypothetical protein PsW64_03746 [Pseudovibrio sp. W64]